MVNKKAQMKIQQMAFLLIAITLFFVLVGLFVISTAFSGLTEKAEVLQEEEALTIISNLAASPEFSCGGAYGGQEGNCIDEDKLVGILKNREFYRGFWKVKSIEIRKIYPEESEIECTPQNISDCGIFKIQESPESAGDKSTFTALCRKEAKGGEIYNKCELARILVGF